jgi:ubiquinone/menaquinone biosynthesis C-methylase UbiE
MNDRVTQPKSPIGRYLKIWQQSRLANVFKKKRFDYIDGLVGGIIKNSTTQLRILELGCGRGEDFIRYAAPFGHQIVALDINDRSEVNKIGNNVTFVRGCVTEQSYLDSQFDIVVSLGTLEHVAPISYLDKITREISRISRSYVIMVPSISTPIEPHTLSFFWQIRSKNLKKTTNNLYFYSDETWQQFSGITDSNVTHEWYMPGICMQYIYRKA